MQCNRKDRGKVRAIPEEILKKAFALKEELPTRSIREIIEMLELSGEVTPGSVKHSTLSRLVARHTGRLRAPSPGKTFRRYQKENVNDTWQSDVKHCIYLPNPQNPKEYIKTCVEVYYNGQQYRNAEPLIIRANVWDGETEPAPAVTKQEEAAGELQTSFLKLLQEKHEQKLKDKAHRIHYAKLYQKEDDPRV